MVLDAEFFTSQEAMDYVNLDRNITREVKGGSFLIERDLFKGTFQVFFFPGNPSR